MSVYGGGGSRVTYDPHRKEGHRHCVLGADDEPTAPGFTSGAGGHKQLAGRTLKTVLIRDPFGMPHRPRAGQSITSPQSALRRITHNLRRIATTNHRVLRTPGFRELVYKTVCFIFEDTFAVSPHR